MCVGLVDLFRVTFVGRIEGPRRNSYLRLEHAAARGHPVLRELEDAPRIINGVGRVEVEAKVDFPNPPLTLIPSYPDLPMEKVYPRVPKTNQAEVYLREFPVAPAFRPAGSGDSAVARRAGKPAQPADKNGGPAARVVYFPWDIDRAYWEVLCVDHSKLLRNAVEWAMNGEPPVKVAGAGVVDVTVWRQKQSMTVHLVNLTNPMMMKGPLRELIPLGEQTVRVRLPEGKKAKRVQLLAAGKTVRAQDSGGYLTVTVPSILDHEVVAIDWL